MANFEIKYVPAIFGNYQNVFAPILNSLENNEYINIKIFSNGCCRVEIPDRHVPLFRDSCRAYIYGIDECVNDNITSSIVLRRKNDRRGNLTFPELNFSNDIIMHILSLVRSCGEECGFGIFLDQNLSTQTIRTLEQNGFTHDQFRFRFRIYCFGEEAEKIANFFVGEIGSLEIYNLGDSYCVNNTFIDLVKTNNNILTNKMANILPKILNIDEVATITSFVPALSQYGMDICMDTICGYPIVNHSNDIQGDRYITLGHTFHDKKPINISLEDISHHVFIAGATGSGKGNLIINIAKELHSKEVPFLIIESAKTELHHLKKEIEDLKVWKPGPGEFVIDPFAIPEDLNLRQYGSVLKTILNFFDVSDGPLIHLYRQTLDYLLNYYMFKEDSTWKSNAEGRFGISEFLAAYRGLCDGQRYGEDVQGNMYQAGINRAESFLSLNEGIYDTVHSIPIKHMLTGYNVLQLSPYITDQASRQIFASLLLTQINTWLINEFHNEDNLDLQLVIIMDESHNLLKDMQNVDDPNGKASTFIEDFQNNLLQHRSLGIGYIVADQFASNLPEKIIQSCATKIYLGSDSSTGIRDYSENIGLTEDAIRSICNFKPGQGIVYNASWKRGVPFQTEDSIRNLKVNEKYDVVNESLRISGFERKTICAFKECSDCRFKNTCTYEIRSDAGLLANNFYTRFNSQRNAVLSKFVKCYRDFNFDIKRLNYTIEEYAELLRNLENFKEVNEIKNQVVYGCFWQQLFRLYKRKEGYLDDDFKSFIDYRIEMFNKGVV